MSTTWTFAQMVDTLKTQLEALAEIQAFDPQPEIRVSMPHAAEDISDVIVLGTDAADTEKEQTSLGANTHDEFVTIGCLAAAIRYGSGDVEALSARDRVLDYLKIIDEQVRTTPLEVGLQTHWVVLENRVFESFPSEVGESVPVRVARVSFDINYRARTTP